jgi:hypothetical protein
MRAPHTATTWQIVLWLAKNLLHQFFGSICIILLLNILATSGVIGSIAGLYSLYQLPPGEALTLDLGWKIQIASDWRLYSIITLGFFGIICGLALYQSHRMSVAVAAAHFLQINRGVLDILSAEDSLGWQTVLLPQITRNLFRLTNAGIKSTIRASLILIKSIIPMLLLAGTSLAMLYTSPQITLLLLPLVTTYLYYLIREDRHSTEERRNLEQAQNNFRANHKKVLDEIATKQSEQKEAVSMPDTAYLEIGKAYLQHNSKMQKLKSSNTTALFGSLLLIFGYSAMTQAADGLSQILTYFVLLTIAFRSLENLVSSLFLVSKLAPNLELIMRLLAFHSNHQEKLTPAKTIRRPANAAEKLKIYGFHYLEQKELPLTLPASGLVFVWQDEPINRFTLPGLCLLLEQWSGLQPMSLLKFAHFAYSTADLTPNRQECGSLFISDGLAWEPATWSAHKPVYLVTNDIQRILNGTIIPQKTEEPICLLVASGELLGYGIPSSLKRHEASILKKIRKARRKSNNEDEDEYDD